MNKNVAQRSAPPDPFVQLSVVQMQRVASRTRTPKHRKRAIELQVKQEHPDWPAAKVGSEARWRMRREDERKAGYVKPV